MAMQLPIHEKMYVLLLFLVLFFFPSRHHLKLQERIQDLVLKTTPLAKSKQTKTHDSMQHTSLTQKSC